MRKYDHKKIEKKWQKIWKTKNLYEAKDKLKDKENFMVLTEFPYPSGNLHIGHWYAFAVPDISARYYRMNGKNVMYPVGFDAFGLPAENAAIKRNINPRTWTESNIKYMTNQLQSMGASFDWSREISTVDPEYYKWTQWIFLKMHEKGLVYRAETNVNWCPNDKTVLANEQVINGSCERCGTKIEERKLAQWMIKITDYAERLLNGLENLDWPENTKLAQKNWIGKSEGTLIPFNLKSKISNLKNIEVFTTRIDTIFGVTYLVLAPEHELLRNNELGVENYKEVKNYTEEARHKTELQRISEVKNKTGVELKGVKAINPANSEELPIWVADYVLASYGTGAVMAVPAHDERDFEFAKKYNLPISNAALIDKDKAVEKVKGKKKINYRLRDWVISRQRYWGVPIPMINCVKCGYQPVPEKDLPVKLPKLDDYKPNNDGRSPLAKANKWLKAKCPNCGEWSERETDTMDTFVDSSWYFFRYADPKNKKKFADEKKIKSWLPVQVYIGGAEHNTMHLLYSRFFSKFLKDLGYADFEEPFVSRRNHGMILGPDGHKMSKSKGNVIDPDELVRNYGADTVRMYLAFMGDYFQGGPWDSKGINGVKRFLERVWKLESKVIKSTKSVKSEEISRSQRRSAAMAGAAKLERLLHQTIKKVTEDIENFRFNTAISSLMILLNEMEGELELSRADYLSLIILLSPFAPHLTEEIWQYVSGKKTSIHLEKWPEFDTSKTIENSFKLIVQINGKTRDFFEVPAGISENGARVLTLKRGNVKKWVGDKHIEKIIYVPNKIINIVTQI